MSARLGLDTQAERDHAFSLVERAHQSGLDAAAGDETNLLTFQIGYIRAIENLAEHEGAQKLALHARSRANELDKLVDSPR